MFHPNDQDMVYRLQPAEGLAFLFSLAIDAIFHKQISLEIGRL
jgi:hypothetical protein